MDSDSQDIYVASSRDGAQVTIPKEAFAAFRDFLKTRKPNARSPSTTA